MKPFQIININFADCLDYKYVYGILKIFILNNIMKRIRVFSDGQTNGHLVPLGESLWAQFCFEQDK